MVYLLGRRRFGSCRKSRMRGSKPNCLRQAYQMLERLSNQRLAVPRLSVPRLSVQKLMAPMNEVGCKYFSNSNTCTEWLNSCAPPSTPHIIYAIRVELRYPNTYSICTHGMQLNFCYHTHRIDATPRTWPMVVQILVVAPYNLWHMLNSARTHRGQAR